MALRARHAPRRAGPGARVDRTDVHAPLNTIALNRLRNQSIAPAVCRDAASVVSHLGAVQAQEFGAAIWALALRMRRPVTASSIGRAFDDGRILRTHVLRPTWHFVTPQDIRWMLDLTGPRVLRAIARVFRSRELDTATCVRASSLWERALADERFLTRAELASHLASAGIIASGVRLAFLTMYAELHGVICSGPRRGKQMTYALLADRAPTSSPLPRDEALAKLVRRFFASHGPATLKDFSWWSGLTMADGKRGLEINRASSRTVDGLTYWTVDVRRAPQPKARAGVHLLPIYDEYIVAYRDLAAVPRGATRGGFLPQPVIAGGQVAGTWKAVRQGSAVVVEVKPDRPLRDAEHRGVSSAVKRYGAFFETAATTAITAR